MNRVRIEAGKPYDVLIGAGLLDRAGELCREVTDAGAAALVTDGNVDALYAQQTRRALERAGFRVEKFVFEAGEHSKSFRTLERLLGFLARRGFTRSDLVVALGGGVTGDLAGFAASCYLRGVRYVQIPTTLLAAVDSSVGGKTAIDIEEGKNLVGAFYQPARVILDTNCFDTLPRPVYLDGVSESVKYGVICDRALFDKIASGGFQGETGLIVERCVRIKGEIVAADEFDRGRRQLLNLGHTVGHAMEKLSGFSVSHGQAVSAGMAVFMRAARARGLCPPDAAARMLRALDALGLKTHCPYGAEELYQAALSDKKRQGGSITLAVPCDVGDTRLMTLPVEELRGFIRDGLEAEQ